MKYRRVEGQDDGVDTEECVPAQHFSVSVLEIEGFVWSCSRGIGWKLVIGSFCGGRVDGRFIIIGVRDREVRQSGDAGGRRLGDGYSRRWMNCARFWGGDQLRWRGLGDLRFEIPVRKSKGCDNGGCGGISLAWGDQVWPRGREYGWGREALPATLP